MSHSSGARSRVREKQRRDALKEAIEGLQGKLLEHDESFRQEAQRRTATKASRVAHTAKSVANEAEHWSFTKVEIVNQAIHTIEEVMAQNREMKLLIQELAKHAPENSPTSAMLRGEADAAVAPRPRNVGFHQGVGPLTAVPLVGVPQEPTNKKFHVDKEASTYSTFERREPKKQTSRSPPGGNPAKGGNLDQQTPEKDNIVHVAMSLNLPNPSFKSEHGNPVFVSVQNTRTIPKEIMVMPNKPREPPLPLHLRLTDTVSYRRPAPSEAALYSRLLSEQIWAPSSIAARRAPTNAVMQHHQEHQQATATHHSHGRLFPTLMTLSAPTFVDPSLTFAASLQNPIQRSHKGLLPIFLSTDSNANLPFIEATEAARSLQHEQPAS